MGLDNGEVEGFILSLKFAAVAAVVVAGAIAYRSFFVEPTSESLPVDAADVQILDSERELDIK